ncbi:putative ribonuclease H-like domain-containing protein, partial [Tanacetum coccineum]
VRIKRHLSAVKVTAASYEVTTAGYVSTADDIIFGSTKKEMCTEFEKMMHKKFQMGSMGELTFFLGLQVTQKEDGIFISQDKYVDEILKKFGFLTVKTTSTPMETSKPLMKDENAKDVDVHLYRSMIGSLMYLTSSRPDIIYLKGQPKLGLWYAKDSPFDLEAYTDSDYAGASLDRKSTTGGCQFLKSRLILRQCKKQTMVANSTTEAEYVAASNCREHVLSIQNQLLDYGYNFMNTKIFIGNESTICIVKFLVFHSKTKHIEIRNHFIRDSNEKKLIQMIKIHTDQNVADLLTKAFDVSRFQYLIDDWKGMQQLLMMELRLKLVTVGVTTAEGNKGNLYAKFLFYIPQGTGSGSGPRRQDTILGDRPAQTRFERLSKQSNDPPLSRVNTLGSGEDNMKLNELIEICTKLSERVLALENIKTTQDLEITNLKKRVKKLEKKQKSRTLQLKRRLFKFRIESSAKKSLGNQEDASKQGRNEIDQDEGISWFQEDAETQGRYGHDIEINTLSTSITIASINITTAEPVTTSSAPITTAGVSVSTAKPSNPPTTTTTFIEDEDLIIAQTLMKMRSVKSKEKSKEKGVSSETGTRLTRGVIMKEASETTTRPTVPPQQQLDPKDKDEAMLEKEREEEASNAELIEEWDSIEARIDADAQLAERLQAEEREQIAEEQRNKPPTKAEQRKKMYTYMKHMAGYNDKNFKGKSFDAIKKMFDKAYKQVNDFVPMDTESSRKKVDSSGKKADSSKKRTRAVLGEESVKRQKVEDDAEKAELKACLEIVPGDDSAVNVESLATKYLIVDWKTHILAEDKMYYQIIRDDGSTKYYKIFSAMLNDFDKQDVLDLYRLVKERFETTSLEGYDRLLWRDLITLFEPNTGITIHMLVEKKYPLTQEMLSRMLSRRLEVDHECEMTFELLRFIKSRIKRHLSAVKVTTASYEVTTAGYVSTASDDCRKYSKSLLLLESIRHEAQRIHRHRQFLRAKDERKPMFVHAQDPDYVPEPIYPEYIPLEDEHEFSAEEQPILLVDSPTTELLGYVTESDTEEDPKEYEDDETEDGLVDYPMDVGDDGDDDEGDSSRDDANDEDEDDEDEEEEEEEHLAPADSAIVVPVDEPIFPPEGTEPVIPPPSTDITIGARITIRP